MGLDLEIIDYDLEGAAYRDGRVVDAAYLIATVRRRPIVDANRVLVQEAGDLTRIRIPVEEIDAATRAEMFDLFTRFEALVKAQSESHIVQQMADPKALERRIEAAADADRKRETAERERLRLETEHAAKLAEIAKLDAEIAGKRAAIEAVPTDPNP